MQAVKELSNAAWVHRLTICSWFTLPEDTFHMMGPKLLMLYSGCSFEFCLLVDLVLLWIVFINVKQINDRDLRTASVA